VEADNQQPLVATVVLVVVVVEALWPEELETLHLLAHLRVITVELVGRLEAVVLLLPVVVVELHKLVETQ
jgi:hypothetical protein